MLVVDEHSFFSCDKNNKNMHIFSIVRKHVRVTLDLSTKVQKSFESFRGGTLSYFKGHKGNRHQVKCDEHRVCLRKLLKVTLRVLLSKAAVYLQFIIMNW